MAKEILNLEVANSKLTMQKEWYCLAFITCCNTLEMWESTNDKVSTYSFQYKTLDSRTLPTTALKKLNCSGNNVVILPFSPFVCWQLKKKGLQYQIQAICTG